MIGNLAYEDYQQMIDNDGVAISVAEVHGLMTGMLCADQSVTFEKWQSELKTAGILAEHHSASAMEYLATLFDRTRDQFTEDEFEFEPCLLEDDYPLDERVRALSEWCQGFLHGLGYMKVKKSWPGQCNEIINDFIAISNVDTCLNDEDDENSLVELIEYVRVGVELIRAELRTVKKPGKVH